MNRNCGARFPFLKYLIYVFPVPGSEATPSPSIMVWYHPPKKNRPFALTLQHFRPLHAICSISWPQPSTCHLFAAFKSRILRVPIYYHILPLSYSSTTDKLHQPSHFPRERGQPHTLPRYLILRIDMYMYV